MPRQNWPILLQLIVVLVLLPGPTHAEPADTDASPPAPTTRRYTPPAQPPQPDTGFGGRDYPHATVTKSQYLDGDHRYWLFEPAEPKPDNAPLIIFLHGWSQVNPRAYGAWIEHLVRRGNIVVYPKYQKDILTNSPTFMPNMLVAVKHAMNELTTGEHVRPQLDKVAVVGHSVGGILAINLAAVAAANDLPQPRAVFVIQPGVSRLVPFEDLSKIPADTLLLTLISEDDEIVPPDDAHAIHRRTTQIPDENKNLLMMFSDYRGGPYLFADHAAPIALDDDYDSRDIADPAGAANRLRMHSWWETPPDALDFHGFWRLLDALTHTAFTGELREHALGNTAEQRNLGTWSDGTPIKPVRVVDSE